MQVANGLKAMNMQAFESHIDNLSQFSELKAGEAALATSFGSPNWSKDFQCIHDCNFCIDFYFHVNEEAHPMLTAARRIAVLPAARLRPVLASPTISRSFSKKKGEELANPAFGKQVAGDSVRAAEGEALCAHSAIPSHAHTLSPSLAVGHGPGLA